MDDNDIRKNVHESPQEAAEVVATAGGKLFISGKRIVASLDDKLYILGGPRDASRWRVLTPVEPSGIL